MKVDFWLLVKVLTYVTQEQISYQDRVNVGILTVELILQCIERVYASTR